MTTSNKSFKSELFKRAHGRASFFYSRESIKSKHTYKEVFAQCLKELWEDYNGVGERKAEERERKLTVLARSNKKVARQLSA